MSALNFVSLYEEMQVAHQELELPF